MGMLKDILENNYENSQGKNTVIPLREEDKKWIAAKLGRTVTPQTGAGTVGASAKASDFYKDFQQKTAQKSAAAKPIAGRGAATAGEALERASGISKQPKGTTIQAKTYDDPNTVYADENAGFWGTTGAYAKKALKDWGRDTLNTIGDYTVNQLRYGSGSAQDPTMQWAKEMGMLDNYSFDEYNRIVDETEKRFVEGAKERVAQSRAEEERIATKSALPQWEREWASRIGQTANMLPRVGTGIILGPEAGKLMLGAQVYGGRLGEALADGASIDEARMYALGSAAMETAIENAAGGIPGMGKGVLTQGAIKLIQNPATRNIVGFIVDTVGEGGEEVAAAFLTPYLQRAVYNPDAPQPTYEEYKEAFLGGVTGSLLLGGGQQILNRATPAGRLEAAEARAQKADRQAVGAIDKAYGEMRSGGLITPRADVGGAVSRANTAEQRYATKAARAGLLDADRYKQGRITFEDIVNYKPMETVKREYAAAVDNKMAEFAAYAVQNPQDNKSAYQMKDVSSRQAADIKRLTGIDVKGFGTEAKANAFRHIAQDHGKNGTTDQTMADVRDVARMQYVIDNYTNMELLPDTSTEFRDRNQRPTPMVKISRRVNGTYYVVEAVPDTSRNKLEIITAYKEAAPQTRDANSPHSDARNASGYTASDNSIPQSPGKSNSNFGENVGSDSRIDNPSVASAVESAGRTIPQSPPATAPFAQGSRGDRGMATAPEPLRDAPDAVPYTEGSDGGEQRGGIGTVRVSDEARAQAEQLAQRLGRQVAWYNGETEPENADSRGYYDNGVIHINEYAQDPARVIFGHEVFHSLPEADRKALTDFIRENSNTETEAFRAYRAETEARYRARYEREGRTFTEADFWEEFAAENMETFFNSEQLVNKLTRENRTLVQKILNAIRDILERVSDVLRPKSYTGQTSLATEISGLSDDVLRQAERMLEGALGRAAQGTIRQGDGKTFSIETLPDGKKYVQADEQVIHSSDKDVQMHEIMTYVKKKVMNGQNVEIMLDNGEKISITGRTAWKLADKGKLSDTLYLVKGNAAGVIDEVVQTSQYDNHKPSLKEHSGDFASKGFDYRTAYFRDLDGGYYRLTLSVGVNQEGKEAYNIGRIEKIPFPEKSVSGSKAENGKVSFDSIVSQDATDVNTNIRQNSQNDTAKFAMAGNSTSQDGKERSKFYDSLQEAETVDEGVKQGAKEKEANFYYQPIANDETMKKAVEAVNENITKATTQFMALEAETAQLDDIAKGFVLLKQYQDAKDYESAVAIAQKLSQVGTEKGRQVQIYSILGRLTPEGMLHYATGELEKVKDTLEKQKGRAWVEKNCKELDLTESEAKWIVETMTRVQNMEDGRSKAVMLAKIQKLIQEKIPSTGGEKLAALQRISLLLNPKTVIMRNGLSNLLMNPVYAVTDFLASGADRVVAKTTGVRTVTAPNYKQQLKGMKKGFFESLDDFRQGINTRNIQADAFTVSKGTPFKGKNKMSKVLALLDRVVGTALDIGDRPFFEGYFLQSLNGQIKANHVSEPTAEMIEIATQTALEKTWQDDNIITKSASAIKKGFNLGRSFGIGSSAIPFIKSPSNIGKAIFIFSPVGFAKAATLDAYRFTRAVKTGTVTAQMQRQFADRIGKGIAGIILYAAAAAAAMAGFTSGSDDEDAEARNFKRNVLGVNPHSVKIGNKTFTYDWMQPLGSAFTITADLERNHISEKNMGEIIGDAIIAGGQTLFNQSMLSGLSQLFGGYDDIVTAFAETIIGTPSQFVPTLSKQVAELTDPYARRTAGDGLIDTAVNKVKARIPGATKTLEPVVDVLGRDVKRYGGKNNWFNVFLNPANVNAAQKTPEAEEIWRLYEQTGDNKVFPKVTPKDITYNGLRFRLSPKEQTEFQRVTGQKAADDLARLFKSAGHKKATDEEKAAYVVAVLDRSQKAGKNEILSKRDILTSTKDRFLFNTSDIKDEYAMWDKVEGSAVNKRRADASASLVSYLNAAEKDKKLSDKTAKAFQAYVDGLGSAKPTALDEELYRLEELGAGVEVLGDAYDLFFFSKNNVEYRIKVPGTALAGVFVDAENRLRQAMERVIATRDYKDASVVEKKKLLSEAKKDVRAELREELKARYGAAEDDDFAKMMRMR